MPIRSKINAGGISTTFRCDAGSELRRTQVDALMGMLVDFTGITYRRPGESDVALMQRGRMSAVAFDQELLKMGISKQPKRDSDGLEIGMVGGRV